MRNSEELVVAVAVPGSHLALFALNDPEKRETGDLTAAAAAAFKSRRRDPPECGRRSCLSQIAASDNLFGPSSSALACLSLPLVVLLLLLNDFGRWSLTSQSRRQFWGDRVLPLSLSSTSKCPIWSNIRLT